MKIEVDSKQARNISVREGKSASGRDWCIRSQKVWMHNGGKYPVEAELVLPDSVERIAEGVYNVDFNQCIDLDRYNQPYVSVELMEFVPVK